MFFNGISVYICSFCKDNSFHPFPLSHLHQSIIPHCVLGRSLSTRLKVDHFFGGGDDLFDAQKGVPVLGKNVIKEIPTGTMDTGNLAYARLGKRNIVFKSAFLKKDLFLGGYI